MKFWLVSTCTVLYVAGVCASPWSPNGNSLETLSDKEQLRMHIISSDVGLLLDYVEYYGIENYCKAPLSDTQIEFLRQKFVELIQCRNATVDRVMEKIDDDTIILDGDDKSSKAVQLFAEPLCNSFDDIFKCFREFRPVIDLCLSDDKKNMLYKIYDIAPLIQQTVCLNNGTLVADIARYGDGLGCVKRSIDSMSMSRYVEIFKSNSTELFGDIGLCNQLFDYVIELHKKLTSQCIFVVKENVKFMLRFFCEGTQCGRFIDHFHCA